MGRNARRQVASRRHLRTVRRGARPGRQRDAVERTQEREGRRPLHRPRSAPNQRPGRRPLHGGRRDARASLHVATRPESRLGPREAAAVACADQSRDLPPRRCRARSHHHRRREGAEEVIGLAEIAGPIACLGLAVLLVARTRRNRIAGLAYAGVGTILLVASFSPASVVELVAAIAGALVLGPLLAWVFRREPWLVAYATLAFVPFR